MNSRENILSAINHQSTGRIPIDSGSTAITGMHCTIVEGLRKYFGLPEKPVKICEPYQMLGWIDNDLRDELGIDTSCLNPPKTMFGYANKDWKLWRTPWGQDVLVGGNFMTHTDKDGNVLVYPEGDTSAPASGHMPAKGYFFDTIERMDPDFDEDDLKLEDNLQEFGLLSEVDINHWKSEAEIVKDSGRAVLAHLPGTALGDIAIVPGPFLKHPKGVRGVADWYMLVADEPDFIKEIFRHQVETALQNLATLNRIAGDVLDIGVVCGTDFGTQTSQFCSSETLADLWIPYYRQINDWIHENTSWKTFKHSCGAVEPFIGQFIEAGFDILNPVQCSATGMDPKGLKTTFGDKITFWGGGVDTQHTLPFGTADEVFKEVTERCRIFSPGGGFVFNSIHNIQARTPIENVVSMFKAVREFPGE